MRDDDALLIPGLRRIPHNAEAEVALLGAILVNNKAFDRVRDFLQAEHFSLVEHAALFRSISDAINAGMVADPVTLRGDPRLAEIDMFRMAECAVSVVDAGNYGRLVHELYRRRQLIDIGEKIIKRAYESELEDVAAQQIAEAEQAIEAVCEDATRGRSDSAPLLPSVWTNQPVPEREWLVADWIPAGCVVGLMGRGGVGKTLIAQQLQAACALGLPWLGLSVSKCRSLGVYCEDDVAELQRRQVDIANSYGAHLADTDDMLLWSRAGYDSRLAIVTRDGDLQLQPFFWEVRRAARKHKARLIVLDNAGDLFTLNQNDDVHARLAVNAICGRLVRELNATLLLLRHPSRAGLTSGDGDAGSVAWTNSFRGRLYLDYEPAADGDEPDKLARVLSHKKSNYSAQASDLRLRWQEGVLAPLTRGGFVDTIEARAEERTIEQAFLAALDEALAAGLRPAVSRNSSTFAPRVLKRFPSASGFRVGELDQCMARLLASGAIVNAPYGPPSRGWQALKRNS